MNTKNEIEVVKPVSFYRNNPLLPLDEDGNLILNNETVRPVGAAMVNAVLDLLEDGLSFGLGEPAEPGSMCVEAAVSAAMGMNTKDGPVCVNSSLRSFKISLNDDVNFNDDKERALILRRIAVAQLGTEVLTTKYYKNGKPIPAKKQPFKFKEFNKLWAEGANELRQKLIDHVTANRKKSWDDNRLQDEITNIRDECYVDTGMNQSDFVNGFAELSKEHKFLTRVEALYAAVEVAVKVLIKMKTPGSKFLYLTEAK